MCRVQNQGISGSSFPSLHLEEVRSTDKSQKRGSLRRETASTGEVDTITVQETYIRGSKSGKRRGRTLVEPVTLYSP